jgi:CDP-diglyceride synthetase
MGDEKSALCTLCFLLICIVLTLLYLIYGIIILDKTSDAVNECNQVWIFCLISLIINGLSFLTGGFSEKDEKGKPKDTLISRLMSAISFGIFVWGCVIYTNVTNDKACKDIYTSNYNDLWILFAVVFWFNVAMLCLVGVFILLACCAMCADSSTTSRRRGNLFV